jgi:hypothetical protein
MNTELFDLVISLAPVHRAALLPVLESASGIENLKTALHHFSPEGAAARSEQVKQLRAQARDGHHIRFLVAVHSPNFSKGDVVTLSAAAALRFIASGEAVLEG